MPQEIVEYSERLGYSRLFRNFIYHPEKTAAFFGQDSIAKSVISIGKRYSRREAAVEILTRQNKSWNAPEPVLESINKLNSENAVAVVAGQQACLFGGPYLVILKALAAIKIAHQWEKNLSLPVVPIFWIAADDHDYKEISSVDTFDQSGELSRLTIDHDPDKRYPPIGSLSYDQSIEREVRRLESLLPDNDYRSDVLKPIERIYRPGKKIVDCFAEYMLSLVGHLGIVCFNPYDEQFKACTAPLMQDIVSRHSDLKKALSATESELIDAHYHVQVQKPSSSAHMFYHAPERIALHKDGEQFRAGESSFSGDELIQAIKSSPLDFSSDALTRPLIQSYFFPTIAVVGGPAEVAYYAQIGRLFDLFDLPRPQMIHRASLTVIEKRYERLLDKYNINFEDLAVDPESIISQILKESYPVDADNYLADLSVRTNDDLRKLKGMFTEPDRARNDMIDRAGEKLDFQLKELGKKMFAAHKRKNRTDRDKIHRARNNLFPDRSMAERSIAPAYLISRYGRPIIDYIYENITFDETGHRLLMLSE